LSEVPAQALQQALKNLERAYTNFFQKRADFPVFKKKGQRESFRVPQGFKVDNAVGIPSVHGGEDVKIPARCPAHAANRSAVPGDRSCDRPARAPRAESSGRPRGESPRTNRFSGFSPA